MVRYRVLLGASVQSNESEAEAKAASAEVDAKGPDGFIEVIEKMTDDQLKTFGRDVIAAAELLGTWVVACALEGAKRTQKAQTAKSPELASSEARALAALADADLVAC